MSFKSLLSAVGITSLLGCAAEEEVVATTELADGAFLLGDVTLTEKGEVTVLKRAQMKIYSNDRYMFAFMHEGTDKPDVGAGLTEWKDGTLIESPIFNQDGSLENLHFSLDVQETEGGFTQSIEGLESNGHVYDMVETWDRQAGDASAFDGLWKLQNRASEEGGEIAEFSEIKMFGGGHFIFSQSFMLEGKMEQHFGFGDFSIDADGVVTETVIASSFEDFAGVQHKLTMELVSENELNQTFLWDGKSITQSYIRQ
ncbi:MAG: hypothetical protein P8M77_03530 [Porticoccaceae bacterium]|nr:hypothetical protein [Porticoccaceae bacterium]